MSLHRSGRDIQCVRSFFNGKAAEESHLDNTALLRIKLGQFVQRIVEMKFFGGLSIEETADALNLSPTTVKRHWATARLWLHHQMSKE